MKEVVEEIIVNFDGAAQGNPGPAGIGIILQRKDGSVVKTISHFLGPRTNNQAEYEAFLTALKQALKFAKYRIVFRTDSELLFRQIKGSYKVKNNELKKYHDRAIKLLKLFPDAILELLPRELNTQADRLAKKAIKDYFKVDSKDEK
ncbi:MAG: ribonuclease HI family protein [candidate division WOR-3 bacterium]